MTIDMHCHIEFGPQSRCEGHEALPYQVEEHLATIGAEKVLLQPYSSPDKSFEGYKKLNGDLAVYIHNTPHLGLARVDPSLSDKEIEVLMKSAVQEMGLSGVKLHPLDGYSVSELSDRSHIFKVAQELYIPVMIHTWSGEEVLGLNKESLEVVAQLAHRYDIPFIAAHVNVGEPSFESAMQNPNLYADISLQPFKSFYTYVTANSDSPLLNRIFYGSDFGICKLPEFSNQDIITPDKVRALPELPDDVANSILEGNARTFIRDYMSGGT